MPTGMTLLREGADPIHAPSAARVARALKTLRIGSRSSHASLVCESGSYVQCAGGRGVMLLEKRDALRGLHFRAYQDTPVVPFEDGVVLSFSAGRISLVAREWFRVDQVIDVFIAFLYERDEPSFVRWRDVTATLAR